MIDKTRLALSFILLTLSSQSLAGELFLVRNGISKHFGTMYEKRIYEYRTVVYISENEKYILDSYREIEYVKYQPNENNAGLGLEYVLDMSPKWKSYLTAGNYVNSFYLPSWYAGSVFMYRKNLSNPLVRSYMDFGAAVLVMQRPEFNNGLPFPAILPALTLSFSRFAINSTFIPAINDESVPTLFLQFKLQIF
ncbi:MAG: hypothetical protein OEY38_13345 [Gammaproteobacteria bacterium]|nr:hypothetical protein [Gammaproteobacteria bacterium]